MKIGREIFSRTITVYRAMSSRFSPKDTNPSVWKSYMREATPVDDAIVERCKAAMEGLLIFAGLFSAVVTGFIIEAYKQLKPDTGEVTVAYLSHIYLRLSPGANGTLPGGDLFRSAVDLPFTPTRDAILANTLLFISLGVSLLCAVLATILQQWARNYTQSIRRNPRTDKQARLRAFLFEGLETYHLDAVIDGVPLLMHVALFCFLVALVYFSRSIHHVLEIAVLAIVVFMGVIYLLASVIPLFFLNAPIHTPLTTVLWRFPFILRGPATIGHCIFWKAMKCVRDLLSAVARVWHWFMPSFGIFTSRQSRLNRIRLRQHLSDFLTGIWSLLYYNYRTLEEHRARLAHILSPQREAQCLIWTADSLVYPEEQLHFIESLCPYLDELSSSVSREEETIIVQHIFSKMRWVSICTELCRSTDAGDMSPVDVDRIVRAVVRLLEWFLDRLDILRPIILNHRYEYSWFSNIPRHLLRLDYVLSGTEHSGFKVRMGCVSFSTLVLSVERHLLSSEVTSWDVDRILSGCSSLICFFSSHSEQDEILEALRRWPHSQSADCDNRVALQFGLMAAFSVVAKACGGFPLFDPGHRCTKVASSIYATFLKDSLSPEILGSPSFRTHMPQVLDSAYMTLTPWWYNYHMRIATERFLTAETLGSMVEEGDDKSWRFRFTHTSFAIFSLIQRAVLNYSRHAERSNAIPLPSNMDLSLLSVNHQLKLIESVRSGLSYDPQSANLSSENIVSRSCARALWKLLNTIREPRCLIEVKTRVFPLFTGDPSDSKVSLFPLLTGDLSDSEVYTLPTAADPSESEVS